METINRPYNSTNHGHSWTMSTQWVFFVFLVFAKKVTASEIGENSLNSLKTENRNHSTDSASEIVKKVIAKGCAKKYTMTCFKMDMVELVDILSSIKLYQIFPGIAIIKDENSKVYSDQKFPDKLIKSLASEFPLKESPQLDEFLITKISDYLSSHSLNFKLIESRSDSLEDSMVATEGRGKGNKGYGSLIAGVMMMKGTLMTIGLGALAALAGKALVTGLLSLMLSAIIGLRSANGQPNRQTAYEIISKPIYSHSHSHSSEISHDHHDHGHGHSSYSYGRNLDFNDENNSYTKSEVEYVQLPAREEEEEDHPNQGYHYNSYGNIEYKTITEDDLKAYYNNLEHNNGGGRSHIGYRHGKSLEGRVKPLKLDSSNLPSIPSSLNPALIPTPK